MRGKESNDLVVGEATSLGESIYSAANLNVDKTFVKEGREIILFNDFVG